MTIDETETSSATDRWATVLPAVLPDRDIRRKPLPIVRLVLSVRTFRRLARVSSLVAVDVVGVVAALFASLELKLMLLGHPRADEAWTQAEKSSAFACLVTILMFARANLYADRTSRPGAIQIASSLFQVAVISLVFALVSGQHFSSYYIFYSSLAFGTLFIALLRELHTRSTAWLLDQSGYRRRAILVGSGHHCEAVAQALADRSRTKVDIVGLVTATPAPRSGFRWLGSIDHLDQILSDVPVQEVILADPEFRPEKTVPLVDSCYRRGITVHVAPTTMEILMERAEFVPGQSVPLFVLRPPVLDGVSFIVKRTFDLVVAALTLALLAPLLTMIALAVKLSSPGPIIYRSMRPGIGGTPFSCLKFRTMREHADQVQTQLEALNEKAGAIFKIREDPRTTRLGRLLRRFSLDELPQLVNVIRGEMSLVGPRPLPLRDFDRLEEWHKKRYLVLPGITGLWQVSGRSELDFDDLVRLDFIYLERWSILLDMVILLRTIPAVLGRRGAY